MQRPRDVEQRVDDVRRLEAVAHQFNNFVYILLRGVFSRVVVGRLGYRLPEGQDVAKRVPVQRRWGVDGCVVVARLWRKEAQAAQRPWNDKARPGQEKAKADDERWKKMSPDERLVHFPPSPSLGPSPPPPPPTDTKPSKKRAKSEDGSEKKKKKKKKKRASSADPDADTQL